MFESIRLKAGTWYARMHFRSAKDPIMHFNNILSSARHALVLLPETAGDGEVVMRVIEELRQKFLAGSFTVVSPPGSAVKFIAGQGSTLVRYSMDDLGLLFVPRSELLRKVKKSTFDVALDLNIRFALPSSYLCRASAAPLRIGFVKPYADSFYNFQIQTGNSSNFTLVYSQLLKCIEMF